MRRVVASYKVRKGDSENARPRLRLHTEREQLGHKGPLGPLFLPCVSGPDNKSGPPMWQTKFRSPGVTSLAPRLDPRFPAPLPAPFPPPSLPLSFPPSPPASCPAAAARQAPSGGGVRYCTYLHSWVLLCAEPHPLTQVPRERVCLLIRTQLSLANLPPHFCP